MSTTFLPLVRYDNSRGLYRGVAHNFVIHQNKGVKVYTIGRIIHNKIVPLSDNDKKIAIQMGLTIDEDINYATAGSDYMKQSIDDAVLNGDFSTFSEYLTIHIYPQIDTLHDVAHRWRTAKNQNSTKNKNRLKIMKHCLFEGVITFNELITFFTCD